MLRGLTNLISETFSNLEMAGAAGVTGADVNTEEDSTALQLLRVGSRRLDSLRASLNFLMAPLALPSSKRQMPVSFACEIEAMVLKLMMYVRFSLWSGPNAKLCEDGTEDMKNGGQKVAAAMKIFCWES